MINFNAICQGNIENASGKTGDTVRNFFRIDIYRDVHRHKGDLEWLLCGHRIAVSRDVWIRPSHTLMLFQIGTILIAYFLLQGVIMARLPYVDNQNAGPDQEKVLAQVTQKSGKIANMWKLWSHSPQTMEAFLVFYKTVMKGALDSKLRELAYVKASSINNCAYCGDSHKASARRAGVTDQQIDEIGHFAESSAFSPLEKL